MSRFNLKVTVLLVSLTCFLTLVLPFCVPTAESKVFLPPAGGENNDPPPPPPADPDDVAVNSARGGGGITGGYGFGNETISIIAGATVDIGQGTAPLEAPVASIGRDSTRWLLFVWLVTGQLY